MRQEQVNAAIVAVLSDPILVKQFASAVTKKVLEEKSRVTNDEERYLQAHVVFAEANDPKGEYMISKDVEAKLLELLPKAEIRTRTLGSALTKQTIEMKQTNKGKAYFIKAIVKDMKKYVAKNPTIELVDAIPDEDIPLTVKDLESMDLSELLEVNDKIGFLKPKKAKKLDADELRVGLIEEMGLDKKVDVLDVDFKAVEEESGEKIPAIEPKDAFDPPIDLPALISIANEYETLDDMKEHLKSMSRSKLIKTINKGKMPIITEDKKEKELVKEIIKFFKANLPEEAEAESKTLNGAQLGALSREELLGYIDAHGLDVKVKKKHSEVKIAKLIVKAQK